MSSQPLQRRECLTVAQPAQRRERSTIAHSIQCQKYSGLGLSLLRHVAFRQALLCAAICLAAYSHAAAQAVLTGRVAARGQVLRDQQGKLSATGKPSWVEYVDNEQLPLPPDIARDPKAVAMSTADYNRRANQVLLDATKFPSVLVDSTNNTLLHKSTGIIGRETAFMYGGTDPGTTARLPDGCKAASGSTWAAANSNFSNCPPGAMFDDSNLMVWAPVIGAELEMIAYGEFIYARSTTTGAYSLPYQVRIDEEFVFDVNATIAYANFNPRVPSSRQFVLTRKNNISDLTRSSQFIDSLFGPIPTYSIPVSRQSQFTNFPVEIAMVRINAKLVNKDVPFTTVPTDVELVGINAPPDEAHKATNLTQYVANASDDHQGLLRQISVTDLLDTELYIFAAADDRMIGSRWGLYPSELNSAPTADDPNTPRDESATVPASFSMVTMIRGPSAMNRGLYIPEYNPATRIADVRDSAGNVIKPGREGLELDYNPNPGHSGIAMLHEGDAIKIIVINRATGYTGMARARVHTGPSGITEIVGLNGGPIDLELRPPRLRIKVERHFEVRHGATRNEDDPRTYIIGFEGSGLSSDTTIDIHTEWVGIDPDGRDVLLPESLPGFTGRLAYVDEAQDGSAAQAGDAGAGTPLLELKPAGCKGKECAQDRTGLFQIGGKPGTVAAILPEGHDRGHLYVHLDAQPLQRNVDFSGRSAPSKPDFSINDACRCTDPIGCAPASNGWECAATAVLRPRPMSFVPFLVPFQGAPPPGQPAAPPTWKYRPEMQFSILQLTTEHLNVKTASGETRDILNTSSTLQSADDKVQLIYDLLRDPVAELPRFGNERKLSFTLGNQRYDATLAVEKSENGNVIDFKNIGALKAASPADFLTIRLVQNGNEANVLWEYRFNDARIILEDGKSSIAPGDIGKAIVVATPAWPAAVWSHVESEKGVDATIDATTGVIKVAEESKEGFFTIRAVRRDDTSQFALARIPIGCECLTCKAEGTCKTKTSSVHAEFALGQSPGGGGGGLIVLHDETISDLTFTPRILKLDTLNTTTEAIYDGNGLRQVIAPNTFVDIKAPEGQRETFEMRFYPRDAARGAFNTGYEVNPSATPTAVWTISNPTPGVYTTLRIVGDLEGRTEPDAREFRMQGGNVTLLEGTMEGSTTFKPLRIEEQAESDANGLHSVRETVRDGAGNVASVIESRYETIDDKPMLVEQIVDPDGAALTTTHSYYRTINPSIGAYTGRRESIQHPDGNWTKWLYDEHGRVISEQHPWLDSPFTASTSQVRVIEYSYTDPASGSGASTVHFGQQAPDEDFHRPRVITELITGIVVSKTFFSIQRLGDGSRVETEERCPKQNCSFGANDNLRTVRRYYAKDTTDPQDNDSGLLQSVQHPDGRLDSYRYERGTIQNGEFQLGTGDALRTTVTHGTIQSPDGVPYRSTQEVSTTDEIGQSILDETHVITGGGSDLISSTKRTYDGAGRLLRTEQSNGEVTTTQWGCCNEQSSTDSRGITTTVLSRDALNRVTAEQRAGITTTRTYDALGRVVSTTRTGGALQLTSTERYDRAGRLERSTDEQGLVTQYTYELGGRRTTVQRPGGFTELNEQFADGQPKLTMGSAVVPQYLTHAIQPDGNRVRDLRTARPDSPAFERTVADLLGRTIRVERPAFGGGLEVAQTFYNAKGQVARTTTTGLAEIVYEYDDVGNQTRASLDVDGNGDADLRSDDRITESDSHFTNIDGAWWQETVRRVYPQADDDTAIVVSSSRTRLSGLNRPVTSEQVSVDIHGNETHSITSIDPAQRTEIRRTDVPDSTIDSVSISVDGRLSSSTTSTGVTTTYDYDELGRRKGVTDPRTGRTQAQYDPATGHVVAQIDAANHATTFGYDPQTGRKIRECNALAKCTYFEYSPRGELIRTWGDVPYPVQYVYDDYGRRAQIHTFRVNLGWTAPTWPDGASTAADVTTWIYDEPTGLLRAKEDAAGKAVTYTYGPGGRLATRTWARQKHGGGPLTTVYHYVEKTGELANIDYNDSTPDVTYTYDRSGRQRTVTDGTGSRTFSYDPNNSQLTQEVITGIAPAVIRRTYATNVVKGRPTGFDMGPEYTVSYAYDAVGRMQTVNWKVGVQQDSANYSYLPDSDLLTGITTVSGQATTYQYEPRRSLKTRVTNIFAGSAVSHYDYRFDAIGRRTSVETSGSAFGSTKFTSWGHDDRNQLTATNRYTAVFTPNPNSANEVAAERRRYEYDPIGNREATVAASGQTRYSANERNQYNAVGSDSPVYDDDSNMLNDGRKAFAYNAENQLSAVTVPGVSVSTYDYDYMGRRVRKSVDVLDGSSPDYIVTWAYDVWNKVQETTRVSGDATTSKHFVWGSDLSRSVHGLGGVGGLISVVDQSGSGSLFTYDGNGNVSELVDSSTGVETAHYEYDAFGSVVLATGTAVTGNAYRFSTKNADDETGLIYYGLRFYDPTLGRWLNRDPIGERGGMNLFAFVENRPMALIDAIGRSGCGPDVTINMERELSDLHTYMRLFPRFPLSYNDSDAATNSAMLLAWFARLALKFDYDAQHKSKTPGLLRAGECCPSGDCEGTITVCGRCIDSDVIGNLFFGYAAKRADIDDMTRDLGANVAEILDSKDEVLEQMGHQELLRLPSSLREKLQPFPDPAPPVEWLEPPEDLALFGIGRRMAEANLRVCDAVRILPAKKYGPPQCSASKSTATLNGFLSRAPKYPNFVTSVPGFFPPVP